MQLKNKAFFDTGWLQFLSENKTQISIEATCDLFLFEYTQITPPKIYKFAKTPRHKF